MLNKKWTLPYLTALFIVILYWDNSRTSDRICFFTGYVAGILFIIANAYYPARLVAMKFRPWPKPVILFFRKYLKAHIWMNLVAFVAMIVHCHYSDEGNIFLYGCYLVTLFLTVEGLVMHYRLIPGEAKLLRMLHTQQALFVIWILLILLGHAVE